MMMAGPQEALDHAGTPFPLGVSSFNAGYYLAERAARTNFVMVEIGYGDAPAGFRQPSFVGQRVYVGIEAWLRPDPLGEARDHVDALKAQHPGQNIFFIEHDLDPDTPKPIPSDLARMSHRHPYHTATILPDGAADEVFLGNVFGDPKIADFKSRTKRLLREASRLIGANGIAVVRETLTPGESMRTLSEEVIGKAGLQTLGRYSVSGIQWQQLENVYESVRPDCYPERQMSPQCNFYQFLAKAAI